MLYNNKCSFQTKAIKSLFQIHLITGEKREEEKWKKKKKKKKEVRKEGRTEKEKEKSIQKVILSK